MSTTAVVPDKRYVPICSPTDRKAHAAAHRILRLTASGEIQLACPGARRTAMIDRIADIIREEFGEIPNEHDLLV